MIDHIPPQNIEAEESILSGCINDKKHLADTIDLLRPDDFYRTAHQKIYQGILEIAKNQVDLVLLVEHLRSKKVLDEVGGASYLARLIDFPMPVGVPFTCGIIKEKAILRQIIEVSQQNIQRAFEASPTALDQAQRDIMSIAQDGKIEYERMADIIPLQIERLEALYSSDGYVTGISSGFDEIDKITCGFQPTDLIILAARPGMGKTALALNMAVNCREPVCIFSLEMSKEQLVNRALSSEGGINGQKFRSGRFEKADWEHINMAASILSELPIYIIDTPLLTYQDIIRESRRLKKKEGIKIIIVDYLQFVEGDRNLKENYRYAEISKHLKGAAKELDIPFLVLAQLNRKVEERKYKRPMLSDLRDSGAIEQDADVVAFLYRDEVYNDNEETKGTAEVIFAKQRNGPTGFVTLQWSEKITKFNNLFRGGV